MSEIEYCGINCSCNNKIRYDDMYTPGFKNNDDGIIKCNKCGKNHKIIIKDMIINLTGGEEV